MTTPKKIFTTIAIVCALPAAAFPTILALTPPDTPARTFAILYPLYTIAATICAIMCYPQRRALAWILLVLMLLTHAAMWVLVYQ